MKDKRTILAIFKNGLKGHFTGAISGCSQIESLSDFVLLADQPNWSPIEPKSSGHPICLVAAITAPVHQNKLSQKLRGGRFNN